MIKTIFVSDSGLKLIQSGEGNNCTLEFRFNEFARFKHAIVVNIPEDTERKIKIQQLEDLCRELGYTYSMEK